MVSCRARFAVRKVREDPLICKLGLCLADSAMQNIVPNWDKIFVRSRIRLHFQKSSLDYEEYIGIFPNGLNYTPLPPSFCQPEAIYIVCVCTDRPSG
jgi:hypothetical protein